MTFSTAAYQLRTKANAGYIVDSLGACVTYRRHQFFWLLAEFTNPDDRSSYRFNSVAKSVVKHRHPLSRWIFSINHTNAVDPFLRQRFYAVQCKDRF